MTREELYNSICPYLVDCENTNCDSCNEILNRLFDKYDKQIRAEASDKLLSICNSYPNNNTCVDCSFSKWKDNEWNGCDIAQLKEQK